MKEEFIFRTQDFYQEIVPCQVPAQKKILYSLGF